LRAARVTLADEAMAFDFIAQPPALEGALAVRVELLEHLAALVAESAMRAGELGLGTPGATPDRAP
jgi:hypothetical protein